MSAGTPEPARVERRRWCRCSVAQRARHDFNPECLLHGNTADAALYRDGLADGRSERDAEHAARLAAGEGERDRLRAAAVGLADRLESSGLFSDRICGRELRAVLNQHPGPDDTREGA